MNRYSLDVNGLNVSPDGPYLADYAKRKGFTESEVVESFLARKEEEERTKR